MNENIKKFTKISCYIVLILFVIRCAISFNEVETTIAERNFLNIAYLIFGYIGEVIPLLAILLLLFNKYIWKIKVINKFIGNLPILKKEYIGKIKYTYKNKKKEKDISVYIEQTFLKCTIKVNTDESESNSINADFININNQQELIYTYINIPKMEYRNNSDIHFGTAMIKIDKDKIIGTYFTDRKTTGDIEAVGVTRKK